MFNICTQNSIASFFKNYFINRDSFECRSFYGETFSLALLQRTKLLNVEIKTKLLNTYEKLDKNDSQFHWEFNNYALLDYYQNSNDESIRKYLEPLRFKNTPVTNWTLLRSISRLLAKKDEKLAINEAKEKIEKFQVNSGLILDAKNDKSFQYHCFSMAMIGEIYEHTQDEYFKTSFLKGVEFIINFILSNGEALYIGRGQNQSFGYGALIYILSLAYKFTEDKKLLGDIDKVTRFLVQHQRKDGSFPLVMNGVEKNIPKVINMQDQEFVGWYPYNNYFDYLPFMGFFIAKAEEVLKSLDTSKIGHRSQKEYRDNNFIKIVKANYQAVISKSGGYWTNDMPIPYIVTKCKNITPCYGGEQFQKSLYSLEGIPLPYSEVLKKSIRWRAFSFFRNNTLWIISPFGLMKRDYIFEDNYIDIKTRIFSLFSFKHIYLFLDDDILRDRENIKFGGYEYSASGKLKKYTSNEKISKIRLNIES
ncbi:hypothetical protein HOK00_03480 [bacterium]|jgi:hypothetical protein|nr:hypothetical protein [bacterium]